MSDPALQAGFLRGILFSVKNNGSMITAKYCSQRIKLSLCLNLSVDGEVISLFFFFKENMFILC